MIHEGRIRSRRRSCRDTYPDCEELTARLHADGLSTYVAHALLRADIRSLEEAEREIRLNPYRVFRIRGIGYKAWKEIAEAVRKKYGREIPPCPYRRRKP